MRASVLVVAAVLAVAAASSLSSAAPVTMGLMRDQTLGQSRVHRAVLDKLQMVLPGAKPNVPVWGDVYPVAIYWVFASIGTPARQFPVALDTGSFTLDIPMVGCTTCPQAAPNAFYDVSKSSTGSVSCPDGCTFSNTYETCDLSDPEAPCTISGNYYQDQVSVGGLKSVTILFGGINYMTSNFDQFKYIVGVMGIAPTGGNQDVFSSLFASGALDADVYSMCLVHGSTSNGTFTMGGVDSRLYTGAISYVPNASGMGGYNLAVTDFLIGSTSAGATFQNTAAILDSGTNVLLVTDEQYAAIKDVFMAQCASNPLVGVCSGLIANGTTLFDGTCYAMTDAEIDAFPDLHFNLGTLTLTMHPRDYLLFRFYATEKCLGILPTGSQDGTGLFIVGDTLMQNYLTVLDNANNRIGWAAVNAQTCGSL